MQQNFKQVCFFLAVFLLGTSPLPVQAAPYNFSMGGMPWDTLLTTLGNELTGPIPKTMATVSMVLSALMLMYGETSGVFKKSLQVVLGTCIAINAGDWVTFVLNGLTPDNSSIVPPAVKPMTAPDFISGFMETLQKTCMRGAYNVAGPALALLGMLAVIEIAVGVSFNFEQDHIKYIFKETLKIGFFAFLITQWVGGTFGIATLIGNMFEYFGLVASGSTMVDPDRIVANGLGLIDQTWKATMKLGMGSIGVVIANIIVIVGTILCVFYMVVEIFICKTEFWVISVLTIPLLAFGILKYTHFLFEKATGAIFSMGIKLMVLSFVSAIAAPVLYAMAESVRTAGETSTAASFNAILSMLLGCLVLYQLVKRAPEMAQGLLSGSPSLSGGMKESAKGIVGIATAPARGMITTAGIARAASVMPGGGSTEGGSQGGTWKNLGRMAVAKAKAPLDNTMHSQLYAMQRRADNQAYITGKKDFGSSSNLGDALKKATEMKNSQEKKD